MSNINIRINNTYLKQFQYHDILKRSFTLTRLYDLSFLKSVFIILNAYSIQLFPKNIQIIMIKGEKDLIQK